MSPAVSWCLSRGSSFTEQGLCAVTAALAQGWRHLWTHSQAKTFFFSIHNFELHNVSLMVIQSIFVLISNILLNSTQWTWGHLDLSLWLCHIWRNWWRWWRLGWTSGRTKKSHMKTLKFSFYNQTNTWTFWKQLLVLIIFPLMAQRSGRKQTNTHRTRTQRPFSLFNHPSERDWPWNWSKACDYDQRVIKTTQDIVFAIVPAG